MEKVDSVTEKSVDDSLDIINYQLTKPKYLIFKGKDNIDVIDTMLWLYSDESDMNKYCNEEVSVFPTNGALIPLKSGTQIDNETLWCYDYNNFYFDANSSLVNFVRLLPLNSFRIQNSFDCKFAYVVIDCNILRQELLTFRQQEFQKLKQSLFFDNRKQENYFIDDKTQNVEKPCINKKNYNKLRNKDNAWQKEKFPELTQRSGKAFLCFGYNSQYCLPSDNDPYQVITQLRFDRKRINAINEKQTGKYRNNKPGCNEGWVKKYITQESVNNEEVKTNI